MASYDQQHMGKTVHSATPQVSAPQVARDIILTPELFSQVLQTRTSPAQNTSSAAGSNLSDWMFVFQNIAAFTAKAEPV